jgi:NADPH-dependent 2,4-dienoyl-CoA reductase/sulfur reductase-like enzyme
MLDSRRRALRSLAGTAVLGTAASLPWITHAAEALLPASRGRRVVVVGGGWGGLAAARRLRELAPEMEVVLLERNAAFWSCPLSNRWLADRLDGRLLQHDYAQAAKAFGYTFIRTEVSAIDRDKRQLITRDGTLSYDWLVLAVGIRDNHAAWFGDETAPAAEARDRFGSAWQAHELQALKTRLAQFAGGDLLMTVPPMPYRCPPAPYERACMIASLIRQKKLKARIILLDPNPMMQGFNRVFSGQYREQITYVPQAQVKAVDPFRKTVSTDFETFRFDEAILMPPQQAGGLAWQAELIGKDAAGKPSGWAAQEADTYRSLADRRIFLVGDMIDRASTLFGHYPKSGQMAAHQGRIAAAQIAAEAQGKEIKQNERQLPESTCYVLAGADPMEMMRIETRYRFRGDGLIMQTVKQHYDAQPRDEDVAWAKGMFRELLAAAD